MPTGDTVKPHLTLHGSHSSPGCFILAQWVPRGCIKQVCLVSSAACGIRVLQQPLHICALIGMQAMQVLRWQLGSIQAGLVPCSCGLHTSLESCFFGWRHDFEFLRDWPKQGLLLPRTSRAILHEERRQATGLCIHSASQGGRQLAHLPTWLPMPFRGRKIPRQPV